MIWRLNLQVVYECRTGYMGFPGDAVVPSYEFAELDDLVAFLRDLGPFAGGIDEYADRVNQEGEIVARVAGSSGLKGHDAIEKAVVNAIRRELPPAVVGATSE